jgi:plasmid stabilization system protein ParE
VKKAQVIWSDEALNDLETIYDFLAEKSQPAAQRIVESILSRSKQLESFPESGAKQETMKAQSKEYRYLVEGNYKVIYSYQLKNHAVHIAVIFDTRYDPEKLRV